MCLYLGVLIWKGLFRNVRGLELSERTDDWRTLKPSASNISWTIESRKNTFLLSKSNTVYCFQPSQTHILDSVNVPPDLFSYISYFTTASADSHVQHLNRNIKQNIHEVNSDRWLFQHLIKSSASLKGVTLMAGVWWAPQPATSKCHADGCVFNHRPRRKSTYCLFPDALPPLQGIWCNEHRHLILLLLATSALGLATMTYCLCESENILRSFNVLPEDWASGKMWPAGSPSALFPQTPGSGQKPTFGTGWCGLWMSSAWKVWTSRSSVWMEQLSVR